MVLFVLVTWLTGSPDSQQMTITPTVTIEQCERLVKSVKQEMDIRGRYVEAYCLTTEKGDAQ